MYKRSERPILSVRNVKRGDIDKNQQQLKSTTGERKKEREGPFVYLHKRTTSVLFLFFFCFHTSLLPRATVSDATIIIKPSGCITAGDTAGKEEDAAPVVS